MESSESRALKEAKGSEKYVAILETACNCRRAIVMTRFEHEIVVPVLPNYPPNWGKNVTLKATCQMLIRNRTFEYDSWIGANTALYKEKLES